MKKHDFINYTARILGLASQHQNTNPDVYKNIEREYYIYFKQLELDNLTNGAKYEERHKENIEAMLEESTVSRIYDNTHLIWVASQPEVVEDRHTIELYKLDAGEYKWITEEITTDIPDELVGHCAYYVAYKMFFLYPVSETKLKLIIAEANQSLKNIKRIVRQATDFAYPYQGDDDIFDVNA